MTASDGLSDPPRPAAGAAPAADRAAHPGAEAELPSAAMPAARGGAGGAGGRFLSWMVALVGMVALGFILYVGSTILVPLAVAVMIWYLINALAKAYRRLRFRGRELPGWVRMLLGLLTIFGLIALIINLISDNIRELRGRAPEYQRELERMIAQGADMLGLEATPMPELGQLMANIDIAPALTGMIGALTTLAGSLGLVIVYVLFLLLEQRVFELKLAALFPDPRRERAARRILERIQGDIQRYVWIKTLVSMLTGLVSYAIMWGFGLDYAEFWAFVIFLLNYIPTIGSMIATIFPALLALVQFEPLYPALLLLLALGATQFLIGNILDPHLMGDTLNLSPLVIILAIAVWGSLWGVVGMFLCVPITVIIVIVLSNFRETRPVAILLSSKGEVR